LVTGRPRCRQPSPIKAFEGTPNGTQHLCMIHHPLLQMVRLNLYQMLSNMIIHTMKMETFDNVILVGSKRRPRKLTSKIWKDAEPIYIGGLLMQGRCKYCDNVFPASKVSGTSQLGRHLKVCEVKDSMDGVIKQVKTSDEIDPDWKFDQEVARIELVNLVVFHVLPFTFVEYAGFRKFCASLNPWFKSVNRVTIQNDCMEAYRQFRD
jgi:hypothetical protein